MRNVVAARGVAPAIGLLLLVAAGPSSAHLRFPKRKAERIVELRLDERPIRLRYRIGLGAALALSARVAADADRDGRVSAAEANAALDRRTAHLLRSLRVCTGRTEDALECRRLDQRDVERVRAVGWDPGPRGHLHFAWTLRLRQPAEAIGAIRVEDPYEVEGVAVTEVAVRPPRHTELLACGAPGTDGVSTRFTWLEARRPEGPRVIRAVWKPPSARRWAGVSVVAVLLVGAGAGLLWGRRRAGAR